MTDTNPNNTALDPQPTATPATPVQPPPPDPARVAEIERLMLPYQRWLIVLVVVTVGATCLLISAGHGAKEGVRPWTQNSILRVVVELLNFNYAYPTTRGNDIKWLTQSVGAAAALVTAAVMWYVRTGRRRRDMVAAPAPAPEPMPTAARKPLLEQLSLVTAAQIALVAFGVWSIWSYRWAQWPAAALGEGLRNLIVIIGAVSLGRAMNRWSTMRAGAGMVIVLVLTALVGIWYYYERNPTIRLEFPVGNPIFFAACMLPALILALGGVAASVERLVRGGGAQTATGPAVNGPQSRGLSPAVVLVGSLVTLAIVGYAFALTDSRSPMVALAAGLVAAGASLIVRRVPRERRRLVVLGLAAVALAAAVFVGRPWLERQAGAEAGGRSASFRLRLYTWQYAKDMFLGESIELPTGQVRKSSPLAGQGQGSYMALAQWMSMMPRDDWGRSDMEKDPMAFTSALVGHAHNEWLEILAELGAVGFALMATALGLTFWAAWRAFMRTTDPAEKWFVLALMATLLAIIVEECADVALRMPVLPVIFYTVIAMLWAFGRDPADHVAEPSSPVPSWIPLVGLAGAILGAMSITSSAWRDWEGALAEGRVPELLEKRQWDQALAQATLGRQNRLVIESHVTAGVHATEAAHAAAAHIFDQFRGMIARQAESSGNRARIRELAEGDIARFDGYFDACIGHGMSLWQAMPGIHSVANWMADVFLMKHQMEELKQSIGMEPDQRPFLANAIQCVSMEYHRDRFDTVVALRLLSMSGGAQMPERIDLLRIPLRGGPEPVGSIAGIEAGLRQILSEQNSFGPYLDALLDRAEQALAASDPGKWPDPYAPETFRLKALAESIAGRDEQAAAFAAKAAQLYATQPLRFYHPTVLSHALGEQAKYRFFADQGQPRKAVELVRRAIDAWPANVRWNEHREMLRREMSLYLLGGGEEEAALQVIREQVRTDDPENLKRNLGYGLAELCAWLAARPPAARPPVFREWLTRCLELAPDYPSGRWVATRVALEDGKTADAIEHLKIMQTGITDPQQVLASFQMLARMYPDDAELRAYMEAALKELREGTEQRAASAPAATFPAPGKPETDTK